MGEQRREAKSTTVAISSIREETRVTPTRSRTQSAGVKEEMALPTHMEDPVVHDVVPTNTKQDKGIRYVSGASLCFDDVFVHQRGIDALAIEELIDVLHSAFHVGRLAAEE